MKFLKIILLFLSASAFSQSALHTNLVWYGDFNETSGNLIDLVGTLDGTVTGATQGETGKIGTSYLFDGGDYVTMSDNVALQLYNTNFTIAGWTYISYYPASGDEFTVLGGENYSANVLINSSGKLGYDEAAYDSADASTAKIPLNQWVHFAVVFTYGTSGNHSVTYYINGSSTGTVAFAGDVVDGASSNKIGDGYRAGDYMIGKLDEIGIWKTALTAALIDTLVNGPDGVGANGYAYPFMASPAAVEYEIYAYDKKYGSSAQLNFHDNKYGSTGVLKLFDIHYGTYVAPVVPGIGLYALMEVEDYDGVCPSGSTRENDADCASQHIGTAYLKALADSAGLTKVYINPSYSGTESGTLSQPYNALTDVTITSGRAYLFKRGTTYTISAQIDLSATTDNITFGAYGTGANPIITTSEDLNIFYIVGSEDITVRDLDLRNPGYGPTTTAAFQSVGGIRTDIYNCNIQYHQQAVRTESGSSYRIIGCEIHNIYSDVFLCYTTSYVEVAWCNIHDFNEAYAVEPDYTVLPASGGDGIQFNNPVYNFWTHNTTWDKSTSGNKAVFMVQDYTSKTYIEYCIIGAPNNNGISGQSSQALNKGGTGLNQTVYMKNNIIRGNYAGNTTFDVGIYGTGTGDTLIGNVFIGLSIAIQVARTGTVMLNNSFYNNLYSLWASSSTSMGAFRNNIIYGNTNNFTNVTVPTQSNNYYLNPFWNDPANNDLTLTPSSAAVIDQGYATSYRAYDPEGTAIPQGSAQEIGAYEYTP